MASSASARVSVRRIANARRRSRCGRTSASNRACRSLSCCGVRVRSRSGKATVYYKTVDRIAPETIPAASYSRSTHHTPPPTASLPLAAGLFGSRLRNQRRVFLLWILDVQVEPRHPPCPLIEVRLARRRAVILVRIHEERGRLSLPLQRLHHADGADRIRADVLILQRVIHQDRAGELRRVHEQRHLEIRVLRVPELAPLVLEVVGRERSVIHAVAGDARLEVRGVNHCV